MDRHFKLNICFSNFDYPSFSLFHVNFARRLKLNKCHSNMNENQSIIKIEDNVSRPQDTRLCVEFTFRRDIERIDCRWVRWWIYNNFACRHSDFTKSSSTCFFLFLCIVSARFDIALRTRLAHLHTNCVHISIRFRTCNVNNGTHTAHWLHAVIYWIQINSCCIVSIQNCLWFTWSFLQQLNSRLPHTKIP